MILIEYNAIRPEQDAILAYFGDMELIDFADSWLIFENKDDHQTYEFINNSFRFKHNGIEL